MLVINCLDEIIIVKVIQNGSYFYRHPKKLVKNEENTNSTLYVTEKVPIKYFSNLNIDTDIQEETSKFFLVQYSTKLKSSTA